MELNSWLTDCGSLTERMEIESGSPLSVYLRHQGVAKTTSCERVELDLDSRRWAWIREVELSVQQQTWISARSVVPLATLKGNCLRLTLLKNKPLGPILFQRLGAVRQSMNISKIAVIPWKKQPQPFDLWCRSSIFSINHSPLLIKEVFLPHHPIYAKTKRN